MTEREQLILKMYSSQKKKKIILSILISLFVVGCILICGFCYISSQALILKTDNITIEYGTEYFPSINDFIDTTKMSNTVNIKIVGDLPNEDNKSYSSIGEYKLKIISVKSVEFKGKTIFNIPIEKAVVVWVKDTTIPTFSEDCPTELKICMASNNETAQDLSKYFTAFDLSGVCNIAIKDDEVDYKNAGNYYIEVLATDKSKNQASMTCNLEIIQPQLNISNSNIEMFEGESSKIDASSNISEPFSFISSDNSICTVDDSGNINAIKKGKCFITVSTGNGLTAICNVNVKEKIVPTTRQKPISTTQKSTEVNKEKAETTKANITSTTKNTTKRNYPSKDFLFKDGYTMDNVTDIAYSYLKESGKAGRCVPLKNNEGVYIGMRVIFD